MRAAWWWIDRWRKSTAYTDMTLEEQGAYRNLCDEIVIRDDGVIPAESIGKASGDPLAWQRIGPKVLKWMRKVDGGWTNDTALDVKAKGQRLSDAQREKALKRWESRSDSGAHAAAYADTHAGHDAEKMPPSPSPYSVLRTPTTKNEPQQLPVEKPPNVVRETADTMLRTFNATFGRRLSVTPEVERRIQARIKQGYRPWMFVAMPMLSFANQLPQSLVKILRPEMLLRDGSHPKTTNGTTTGATDWLERELQRLDKTRLDGRLTKIAALAGVLPQLKEAGVAVTEESNG